MTNEMDFIEREIRIEARAEKIFSLLIDPEKITLWMGITAELDPQPGGAFRVDVTGQDITSGWYVSIAPFSRVVFTWGWESEHTMVTPGTSTVEIVLTEEGDSTTLQLRHSGLPELDRGSHGMGWDHYLNRLMIVATDGEPGPDPWTI